MSLEEDTWICPDCGRTNEKKILHLLVSEIECFLCECGYHADFQRIVHPLKIRGE